MILWLSVWAQAGPHALPQPRATQVNPDTAQGLRCQPQANVILFGEVVFRKYSGSQPDSLGLGHPLGEGPFS